MVADSRTELFQMADKIGVQRKLILARGTHREQFLLTHAERSRAVQCGAVTIDAKMFTRILARRRAALRPAE
jgi:hypothetical protein